MSEINHGPLPDGGFWAGFCSNPDCNVLGCPGGCQPTDVRDEIAAGLLEANEGLGEAQCRIATAAGLPRSSSADEIVARVNALSTAAQPVAPATDTASVLAEVLDAIHTYDPLIFSDQHRALFERAATSGARAAGGEHYYTLQGVLGCGPYEIDCSCGWSASGGSAGELVQLHTEHAAAPSAPGVAALLAECARRQAGTGEYAFISCDQIVRLLAPEGADGTEAGT